MYPAQGDKATASRPCSRNRHSRSKPWLKLRAWTNCILPHVGNTNRRR
jgi:hypothetical protein